MGEPVNVSNHDTVESQKIYLNYSVFKRKLAKCEY